MPRSQLSSHSQETKGNDYEKHTSCITEVHKYYGKFASQEKKSNSPPPKQQKPPKQQPQQQNTPNKSKKQPEVKEEPATKKQKVDESGIADKMQKKVAKQVSKGAIGVKSLFDKVMKKFDADNKSEGEKADLSSEFLLALLSDDFIISKKE